MTDSLDDLLSSCSLASRSIRLLTAETKRRTVLLRACCSEYEVALDRLHAAKLDPLRQEIEHNVAEATVQREAGQGCLNSQRVASAPPALSASFQSSSEEVATAPQTATAVSEQGRGHGYGYGQGLVSADSCASDESLRITKSLEEILEQARSIRDHSSSQRDGTASAGAGAGASAGAGGGPPFSSRESANPVPQPQRAATPRKSHGGGRTKSVASSSVRGGGHNSNASSTATPREGVAVALTPRRHAKAKATISTSTSGVGQGHMQRQTTPVLGDRSSVKSTKSAATSRHSASSSNRSASGPRGTGSSGSRAGARRPRLSGSQSQSSATPPGRSEVAGKQEQEQEQAQELMESGGTATEVASNLKSGMWAGVARYEAARRGFVGRHGSNGDSSISTGGGEAAKSSHQEFEAAEEALLRGLDSDSVAGASCLQSQRQNAAQPDPQFLLSRELLLSGHEPHPDLSSERDFRNLDHRGAGSAGGVCPRLGEDSDDTGNVVGREEPRESVGLDRLEEVTRLQRSLVMLLDELEGRRELLLHEFQQKERRGASATRDGSHGRAGRAGVDHGRGGGMNLALRELEDWYCWNKVAHVTSLLRERLDAMAHNTCAGGGTHESLSEEAQALVDNPSFVLGGENPLPSRSDTPDGADCRDQYPHHGRHGAWQQSSVVQALRGSACLGVVQELQANAPSCWPRDSESDCGQTAELFAQQLRTTSILAAETDVSLLVMPTLARELSQASQASQARVQKRLADQGQKIDTRPAGVKQQVPHAVEEVTPARTISRGGVQDAGFECLRERVPKRSVVAGKRAGCGAVDDDKRNEGEEEEEKLWAPALAVFRAVDAVLSGGGRSRFSFVHRGAS